MNKITYLDGQRWYRALHAGIRHVIARQQHLNNINVFPVPDRDTGTNMALTLSAVIDSTYAAPKNNIGQLLAIVADAALCGARGNSGAIIAQFFHGIATATQHVDKKMELSDFINAVNQGMKHSYTALSEPKEGTILTVIKDFAAHLNERLHEKKLDFISLLHSGLEAANCSLQSTTQHLKELKKARVVDAGAQGFVDLLQGIYEFIHSGSIDELDTSSNIEVQKTTSEEITQAIDEKHRFCTECLIHGSNINQTELRSQLQALGDCLVIAGSNQKTKIHIHTNNPQHVFSVCQSQGNITDEKADDMIRQQQSINHKRSQVAILTDSGTDLPAETIAELDIHVVPLQINFGKQTFMDKVSITTSEFYQLVESSPHHPQTSQPSQGDFARQYQYLSSHYHAIIAIHISPKVSGTFNASQAAAKRVDLESVDLINSKSLSIAQGLIVQRAAEAAKAGKSSKEIQQITQDAIEKTSLYIILPDLEFAVQGGRIKRSKKRALNLLGLSPVLSFDQQGKLSLKKCLRGKKSLNKKFAKFIAKTINPEKTYRILVAHCDCEQEADKLYKNIKNLIPKIDSIRMTRTGATLGAHGGAKTYGIALQEL